MEKNKLMRGLGITAGLTAGISAMYYHTTKLLTSLAFDRKLPKSAEWASDLVAGSPKLQEVSRMQKEAARVLRETEHEVVKIQSADGLELVGHLFRCNQPRRLIIGFHGWRSSWASDFGLIVPFWQENHCDILLVEQRGQNESGGEYMGFGLLERYDCVSWANWAQEQNFGLPVYLSGISMGATTVLMAAGMELPECVKGISADCGFTSPQAIWKHIARDNLHLPYTGLREKLVDRLCRQKIQMGPEDYSTVEAMKTCRVPVLFVHGTEDTFVPVEMTYENYNACAAPKQLLIVPGAAHGMSYLTDRSVCEKAMKEFWNRFDGNEKDIGDS